MGPKTENVAMLPVRRMGWALLDNKHPTVYDVWWFLQTSDQLSTCDICQFICWQNTEAYQEARKPCPLLLHHPHSFFPLSLPFPLPPSLTFPLFLPYSFFPALSSQFFSLPFPPVFSPPLPFLVNNLMSLRLLFLRVICELL